MPAAVGLLMFYAGSIAMAWSLATWPRIPRSLAWEYGLTAPFIGFLVLMISVLQPIGSMFLIATGALIALRLAPPEPPVLSQRLRWQ